MQLLIGHDQTVMVWARRRNPSFPTPRFAWGILEKGVLRGAIMIMHETEHTADLGVVSEVPPGPGIARQLFRLMFDEQYLNYARVEITIRRSDLKSRKSAPKWGFKFDGTANDYWGPGVHALRFVMLKKDCPFLRKSDGKTFNSRSDSRRRAGEPAGQPAAGSEPKLSEPAELV